MTQSMDGLLVSPVVGIPNLAQSAIRYKTALADGSMSQGEFDTLTAELLDVNNIITAANDDDTKQAVAEAVEFLSQFLGMI
jgi:hypothetical protein